VEHKDILIFQLGVALLLEMAEHRLWDLLSQHLAGEEAGHILLILVSMEVRVVVLESYRHTIMQVFKFLARLLLGPLSLIADKMAEADRKTEMLQVLVEVVRILKVGQLEHHPLETLVVTVVSVTNTL
jgi:hypothetical protein